LKPTLRRIPIQRSTQRRWRQSTLSSSKIFKGRLEEMQEEYYDCCWFQSGSWLSVEERMPGLMKKLQRGSQFRHGSILPLTTSS
jgi:hypothetical protein